MSCIEEIKLRGLRHPQLFRNVFHQPSVEASLSMFANPRKNHLFSVKMMRIDTVAGLLTTALSRTYPPLIPVHIQDMFQHPNGRFFFELLGMLPELNRYLFVEILDLCCALVDNQRFNQISHSKLAVFPGSCCFGLNEFMPNWDTRYLMSADLKRFSSAFYHAIYAYREERDLTEEQLQLKLDTRERILEEQRIDALEREHGYQGAQAILRMEARIAQGLPAESPNKMKEISLYADRREKVVADDAISVLDIELDDEDAAVPNLDAVQEEEEEEEEEEESVQLVISDLRRSKSVASLGSSRYENQDRPGTALGFSGSSNATSPALSYTNSTRPSSPLSRSNTIARYGSISLRLHPVSPGDIFGISQRAVERKELETFMAVARTVKTRKSGQTKKKTMQQRQQSKLRSLTRLASQDTVINKSLNVVRRPRLHPQPQINNTTQTAVSIRRERAKVLRKELEPYLARGLSFEEATDERNEGLKKQKRRERRAKKAALAKEEAERESAAAAAAAIAAHKDAATQNEELSMEEAEILEAFDYLVDDEFEEFMALAGLTPEDVDKIRSKAAALSLVKVTNDIQNASPAQVHAQIPIASPEPMDIVPQEDNHRHHDSDSDDSIASHEYSHDGDSTDISEFSGKVSLRVPTERDSGRPFNIPHMTSMDMLFKHANAVGDANLRLYPTRPSSPDVSDYGSEIGHGGLLSRAASVMAVRFKDEVEGEDDEEVGSVASEQEQEKQSVVLARSMDVPVAINKAPYVASEDQGRFMLDVPQQQVNNHLHRLSLQSRQALIASLPSPPMAARPSQFSFETVVYEVEDNNDEQDMSQEEDDEAAELRELLESMTETERAEFLRLSNQDMVAVGPSTILVRP
ncbi:hypothetical protein BG006_005127 [Podila minutissima]|uniref:Rho-GAP domain-containing protein n=1 Tax=Podila minutissima TaxID=64525 RepID=A0A9P5VM97_9FUNG|nr:hypothetical protein BG006_005127 [Podila minutissima]